MAARGIDHLVVGVRDLDAAAAFYQRLGFNVGALNRHPWGTHNRIVQFKGCFLELITVGEPELIPPHQKGSFSFGAFVRDALARGEGVSMVALESADARKDHDNFRQIEINDGDVFHFARQGTRPDGLAMTVAFTLAFAHNAAAPRCGFFVCQQHNPENFWNPAFQDHPNGAKSISALTLVARTPSQQQGFLRIFTGGGLSATADDCLSFVLPRGRIEVLHPAGLNRAYGQDTQKPGFHGFSIALREVHGMRERLLAEKIRFSDIDGRLVISPRHGFGSMIVFERG
jgi:catechol 2,3-dioxygenase-like lactoylglutathione lyase family enzyme